MKHTKKFLTRILTVLLVVMTLFSTMSVGFTASAATAEQPEEYTQEFNLGGTPDEAPQGESQVETPEKKPAEEDSADDAGETQAPVRPDKDIANVGANVDVAGTGYDLANGTVIYFQRPSSWTSGKTVNLLIGHSTWSQGYAMTKVSGDIYSVTMPSWGGYYDWAFINVDGTWGGEGNSVANRATWAYDSSSVRTNAQISGNTLYTSSGTGTLSYAYKAGASHATGVSGTFTAGVTGGTAKVAGTTITGGSTNATTDGTGTKSITVLTGTTVTYTATAKEGYTFKGWYTAANGGTQKSTNATYTVAASAATTLYAHFQQNSYTITVKANTGGSVSGGGTVYYNKSTTITATASSGYRFSKWNDGNTNASRTISNVKASATYTASFVKTYTLTLNRNYAFGTVTGAGTYDTGTSVSIKATPSSGYVFSSWSKTSGNSPASTSSASTTVTLTSNTVLQANFKIILTVTAGTGGSVTGGGNYNYNATADLKATPNSGYRFNKWSDGNTNASRSVTVTAPATYTASFTRQYTVTFKDHDGTVLKTQVVDTGTNATPPSNPTRTGYTFKSWSGTYTNVTSDRTITATYTINTYKLTLNRNNTSWGTVSGAGTFNYNTTNNISATPGTGFLFDKWTVNSGNSPASTSAASTSVKLTQATTLTANFIDNRPYVSGTMNDWTPAVMSHSSGNVWTKSYTLNPGKYTFKIVQNGAWYGNNGEIPDTTDYNGASNPWDTYTDAGDITLNATGGTYTFTFNYSTHKLEVDYTPFSYTVTASSSNTSWGTAAVSTSPVNISKTTKLTATEKTGYTFTGWDITGTYTATSGNTSSKELTIEVYSNITAKANFRKNTGTVNFSSANTSYGTVTAAGGSTSYDGTQTSTASPKTGYSFVNWTISGGTAGTDYKFTSGNANSASITIQPITDGIKITCKANFTANSRTIKFQSNNTTGGTVDNAGGSITYPNTVTSKATAEKGYDFTGWTVSGGTAGTDYSITSGSLNSSSSTSLTVQPLKSGTTTFTANFKIKSYTVKFVDWDGTQIGSTQTINHGSAATAPSNPSRTGYTFTGWSTSFSSVTSNLTVTAQYQINTYTVTLAKTPSAGGTVSVNDSTIDYNKTCTITATPATGYDFTKWEITSGTGSLANANSASTTLTVKSNITVRATFTIKKYTVTFKDMADFGGETLATVTVEHGKGATAPTSVATENGWEFWGWNKDFSNITDNTTVTVVRSNKNVKLVGTVTSWDTAGTANRMTYNANGTNTQTVRLPKGNYELKIYVEEWPENAWRGNDGTVVDTTDTTAAAGWDMNGGNNLKLQASGGDYTFTYYRDTNKLKITYVPVTNKVTASASPTAGGTTSVSTTNVNLGDTTTLKATVKPGYTFTNWTFTGTFNYEEGSAKSPTITIKPSTAVVATANFTANQGTVIYASTSGGSVTKMGDNAVTYPNEVKSTATANPGYSFTKWTITGGTKDTDYVIKTGTTSDATIGIQVLKAGAEITATASFTANKSTVKFVAGTGGSVTNAGDNSLTYPDKKQSTATPATGYNFDKWTVTGGTLNTDYKITAGGTDQESITIQPITGKTITATASFTIKTYTVTFNNWDGKKHAAYVVEHGADSPKPSNPTRPSTAQYEYTFKGWDKAYTNVTSNLTITAQYTETVRSYTVTFKDYDGDVLKTQTVQYGKGATAPENPSRSDGYIFDGWDKAFNNITGDLTVTAKYYDNNVYLVGTFTAWDSNQSSTKMSYGNTSTMTLNLDEKDSYEFKFIYRGQWLSNGGTVVNTTTYEGVDYKWDLKGSDNTKLNAIGGTYTFKFYKTDNPADCTFEVFHTPITYTVTFVSDGKTLSTQTVNRGEDAKAPANPTKAADAQYTYTFKEWDKSFKGVRSDLTVNAVFDKTVNKYVVTFKDYDGSVLKTQNVEYGSGATAPADPTREGYTFTGWDKTFNNITGALTVTAKYTINTYKVTFVNWDGTELSTQQVQYGKAATAPDNPTRPATAQYTFTFKGWDKSFNKITANTTITATYNQTVNNYTVKFVNWDGVTVYKTETVPYGSSVTEPKTPTRSDGWVFIGWDTDSQTDGYQHAYENVTGNVTATAQWRDDNVYLMGVTGTWGTTDTDKQKTIMSYADNSIKSLELAANTYTFKLLYDGVWYGNNGNIEDTTTKTSATGWVMDRNAGDCTLTATGGTYTFYFDKYSKVLVVDFMSNAHDVTFVDDAGKVITTVKVEDGKYATSVAPTVTKPATAEYTYTFAGWTPEITTTKITGDTTFKANFTPTKNKYTVTFVNWDDAVLKTETVEYGTGATAPSVPSRPATAQYTYTFKGWDKTFSNITGNITVKAQYTSTVNQYDVTFKYTSADGKTVKTETQSVAYGSAATEPTVPARTDGYTFTGWDKDFHNITGALTVTAQYRDDNIYLNGSFFDDWSYNKTMTKNDDIYTFTVEGLLPGTYQFKLSQNQSADKTIWYGNWGTIEDTTVTTSATGWDMQADADNCTLKASGGDYKFTFNNTTKKLIVEYEPTTYLVIFQDYDGRELKRETVDIGKSATAPAAPSRESTVSHDYTFTGWDTDFSAVSKDLTVKAVYKETLRKYTVTFKYLDVDGETWKTVTQQVEYGKSAVAPTLPVIPDGQALRKWDKDFSKITGDLTVTAEYFDDNVYLAGSFNDAEWTYKETLQTYGNKTVSVKVELAPGTYEFKFIHDGKYYSNELAGTVEDTTGEYWWATNTEQSDNTTLKATGGWYTFTWNTETKAFQIAYEPYMYTVTFKDYNGKTLSTQQVAISKGAKAPATPTRTDGWVFDKWDKDFSSVKSDLTVTALYYDNNIYLMGIGSDWETTDADNRLTYNGTENVVELTLDIGKTAGNTFTQSQHEFKFKQHNTWYTYSPESGISKEINNSTMSSWYHTATNDVDNKNTVLNASGGTYTFKFATDTKDFYIHYEALQYTVRFLDYNMNVLKTEKVDIGTSATPPKDPTRSGGWKFYKWDKDYSCIIGDLDVIAQYYDDNVYLKGDFNNWGTNSKLGKYGDKIMSVTLELDTGTYDFKFFQNSVVDGNIVGNNYTDINGGTVVNSTEGNWWSTDPQQSLNTRLQAKGGIYTFSFNTETKQFKIDYKPNVFDVTFVYIDADGVTEVEKTQLVDLGKDAIPPELPRRMDGWVFSYWDVDYTNVQDNLVVTAKYIDDNIYIAGQFNNWNEKATPIGLTDDENIYKITLEFSTGTHQFKIHKGDGWFTTENPDYAIPDTTDLSDGKSNPWKLYAGDDKGNAQLQTTGGYYTFIFNRAEETLEVKYDPYVYTVTFVDYNDNVLKTEEVAISKGATAPETPARTDGWVFIGWDKTFNNIQSDLTVKAQYRDDNVYLRGSFPECDWEQGFTMKYSETTATYTVRNITAGNYEFKFFYDGAWYTNAGTITESITDWETYDSQENIKLTAVNGSYIITFNKETKHFSVEFKPDIYEVTFYYYGETNKDPRTTVLEVEAGSTAKLPEVPTRTDKWFFLFWGEKDVNGNLSGMKYTSDITNVDRDMEIHAWYYDDNAFLVGDIIDGEWHRTEENKMTYDFESGISTYEIHLTPGKYEFKIIHRHDENMNEFMYGNNGTIEDNTIGNGWLMEIGLNNCVLDATGGTYTFKYNRNTHMLTVDYVPDYFTVTFVDYDGTILDTQTVRIATSAVTPEHATRTDGWEFLGWDSDAETEGLQDEYKSVYSDLTVTAKYYDNKVYIVGDFNNWVTDQVMGPYGSNPVSAGFYLEEGEYKFKLLHNDNWYGNTGNIIDTTTSSSDIGWEMKVDTDDCTLTASGGYYTFSYNPDTRMLEVLYDATEFTVTFLDWNGNILKTETVQRGDSATAPEDPTKTGDVQYSYEFAGWDKKFTNVQENLTVTAQYTQITNKYKVTFNYVAADGTTPASTESMVEYGTAATAPTVPAREDGWVLSGWDTNGDGFADDGYKNITGELTVNALYINGNVYLAGTFNEWHEKNIPMLPTGNANEFAATITLHHGESHEFKIKVGDGWFSNNGTFTDTTNHADGTPNPWDMTATTDSYLSNCHINTTGGYYTFTYNVETKKLDVQYKPFEYKVTFIDYNDIILKEEIVEITKNATAPTDIPERTGGFLFNGWDKDFTNVMSDLTVTAQYYDNNLYLKGTMNNWGTNNIFTTYGDTVVTTTIELEPGTYTFKFYRVEDGKEVYYTHENAETFVDKTDWVHSTTNADIGNTTLIANGGYYTFTFANDTKDFKIDYVPYEYDVTFIYKAADGVTDVIETQKVARGQNATAPTLPFRPDGYEFNGWNKEFTNITEPITVTATYFDNNLYLVGPFSNWKPSADYKLGTYGNTEVSTRVEFAPGEYEFKFYRNGIYYTDFESATFTDKTTDWEATKTDGANSKLSATGGFYTFTFSNNSDSFKIDYEPYVYTVKFIDHDGTVLSSQQIDISKDAVAPADPTREHYNFLGWDKNFKNVQGNLDVYAQYEIHTFQVTFVYYTADCQLTSSTQTVDYGTAARTPELPRRMDGWVFRAWDADNDINNGDQDDYLFVTRDLTVEARYIDDNVYLVGSFNSWNETTLPMELTEDENVVKIKITLDEGSYEFKLKRGDGWFSNNGTITDTTDDNGKSNPWDMTAGDQVPNCTLNTTGGNYTFIYNKSTQKLEVKYSPYTYTVKFVDWDGTVLKTEIVDRGNDASAPMNPTRPDEGDKVYTFKGWDKKFNDVKEDLIVTALYEESSRQLTVKFLDWDGTVLSEQKVNKGEDAVAPAVPSRPATDKFNYTFSGWDNTFTNIQADTTVTATYLEKLNKFTVTFVDYNDKELKSEEVEYGKNATAPENPSRGDDFIFTGWDKEFTNVTKDITVKATYGDNKVYLKGDFNGWGNTAVMQKTGENTYSYTIELEKGSYTFKINRFETWYGNEGEFTDTTDDNGVSNPWYMTTEAGDKYNCTINATGGEYVFTFNTATQMMEVKYILPEFTVVFFDADGTLLSEQTVQYGQSAVAPQTPTAPAGFKFAGWDTDFSFITAYTVIHATYTEIGVQYEVVFKDWDGTILQVHGNDSQMVEAGESAIAPADPTREGTPEFSYTFTGWDKNFTYVTEDMVITAEYTPIVNKYTVKFVDWNGTELKSEEVEYGKSATAPEDPTREGYYFTGWDKEFTNITGNLTVTAQYADANQLFTVTFKDWDGTIIKVNGEDSQTIEAGKAAVAPEAPSRAQTAEYTYVFKGWDKDFSSVTSDMEVWAQYDAIKRSYLVIFQNDDGTELHRETVEYGASATYPYGTPSKPASDGKVYTFWKWSADITNIKGNLTVKAQYTYTLMQYTVKFVVKGNVISTQTVDHGAKPTVPNATPYLASGEKSSGWHTGNGNTVTDFTIRSDMTYHAIVQDTNVYIGGDFNNWGWIAMTQEGNSQYYRYEIDIAQGEYGFKFMTVEYNKADKIDVYHGNSGTVQDTTGNNFWGTDSPGNDTTLSATGGHYIFRYNKVSDTFQVIYGAPKYTVTFLNHDGSVLKTEEVERGKSATPPATPTAPSQDGYTYDFAGWDTDGDGYADQGYGYITRDTVVTALFKESKNTYVVTFQDYDGRIIKSETVEYGGSATAPEAPTRPNYQFTGWAGNYTNVTSNVTVIAQYQGNVYNITVNDSTGGTASANKRTVTYDNSVTLTATPTGDYTFRRWTINGTFQIITGSMTSTTLVIVPTSDIVANAAFGLGVSLTVHSYSGHGYEHLYVWESNGTLTNYPTGDWPGQEQPLTNNFNGVEWKTSNELTMTNGYSSQVGAILNNGITNIPDGSGNLVIFNNTLGWSNVYLYSAGYNLWNGDKGAQTHYADRDNMTRISGTNYWYAYVDYTTCLLFTKDIQDSYDNIYNTEACIRSDYSIDTPTYTPVYNQTTNGTKYYSNGSWSGKPTLGEQSNTVELQSILYKNGAWAGVSEVWIYEAGTSTIVTLRRDLLDLIDEKTGTYNNGVNVENYTATTWKNFVDAYESAKTISGAGVSSQVQIDNAAAKLQAAYDALRKQSYLKIEVTQKGGVGTVIVNDTEITTANGSAQVDFNGNANVSISAPANFYITSIIANGEVLFTNANQTITAKAITLNKLAEDVELEINYERKTTYTITVDKYDETCGTLYYGDQVLSPEGDAIVVFAGESVTIDAVANDGYAVGRWVIDQSGEFYKTYYTFTGVKANHEIKIEWQTVKEITVTIVAKPNTAGVASGTASGGNSISTEGTVSMKIDQFETITLTATTSDPRYIFESWEIEGNYYTADDTTRVDEVFNIVATGDLLITAKYVEAYRKIYLNNEAYWTQPYMHFWGSSLETSTWPGTKMTYDSSIGLWYGYIPYDTTDLQFNDGTDVNQVEFSDVTPNLYNNGTGTSDTYVEKGYYLQGVWNGTHHDAYALEKFTQNDDGTYSITITVSQTNDGYIYVNPTNELSHFWNAQFNGKTDNPQILDPLGIYTETPNQVKVKIDLEDFNADYGVTFTFNPETGEFSWTEPVPLVPTIDVIGTDGRGTNSADASMNTTNDRVGNTFFHKDTVVKVTEGIGGTYETAGVIAGKPVTFSTQVNANMFGTYDYYVYGWVINGTEFVVASNMGNGLYTGSYVFTEDNSTVVPVYFHTDEWLAAHDVKHVTVYAVADKSIPNWNSYFSVYTWYNNNKVTEYEQFGVYPGQLMIPVAGLDGVYYTFIETTSPDGIPVSGITFGNYVKSEYIDTIVTGLKMENALQTYDYYDFVALLEDGKENITFVIKTTNDKYNSDTLKENDSVDLDDYKFVEYTDYSGLRTDIFGNNIEGIYNTLDKDNALYIIQAGDKEVHEGVLDGNYYVQCFIYDATGKFLGTCYSYELHDKDSALWTGILAPYRNQIVYFSYEAMNENRYDGEWYGDNDINVEINVSVNVGITTNGGNSFTVNTSDTVNKATYGEAYVNATEQNIDIIRGSKFTLTAVPKPGYRFVGWYTQDGVLFSTNISYVATSAVGTTYTAVFQELDKDNFYVNHYIYTGVGTTSSYIPKPHGGKAQLYVGIENITTGVTTPLALTESAYISAHVGDKLVITVATDALGADKFFAWYVAAMDKYGFTSFEEVGVDSLDNLSYNLLNQPGYAFERYNNNGTVVGRNDLVYFQFEYVVKEDVHSMTLYSDLTPVSAQVTLEYKYNDRNGNIKTLYVPYTLSYEEIEGFAGNNFTPYTPAYISGDGWVNTILANAPKVDDLKKDTTWVINKAMYDSQTFVLWATQPETLFTITSQIGDNVLVVQKTYGEVYIFNAYDFIDEINGKPFWYNDINNNGKYDSGIDMILTYDYVYGYRITRDMNINFDVMDEYDFNIFVDEPAYGREQSSNSDGSNKIDKVTASYQVNILTPYFYDNETFIPDASNGEGINVQVTVDTLRKLGYEVKFGMIFEQVGSFMPGTSQYPTFEDALKAAQAKNYGVATDSSILINEVLNGYTKPVMTSTGTYCTVYDASDYNLSNKNRFLYTINFNNTESYQKRFYNVYSYITVTTPDGVTNTYISNVQTLNIYEMGTATDVVSADIAVN